MIRIHLVAAMFALSLTSPLSAARIDVLTHDLLANTTNQPVQVYVTGSEPIRGFNLRAQLGDGTGPNTEPVFFSVDHSDSIFSGSPSSELGGVLAGAPQFAQASIVLSNPGDVVAADGLLTTLRIDTTGFFTGEFELRLAQTEIGQDSDLIITGGGVLPIEIFNGAIRIVPEPTSCLLYGGCFMFILVRRYRLKP
jgi:hypothetical protein